MTGKKIYEKKSKVKLQDLNIEAAISKEGLQELIRIGAIRKRHVEEGHIKVGDLYIQYFNFPDIYELAEIENSKIIMKELASR